MLTKKLQVLAETVRKLLSCNAAENLKNILAKAYSADIATVLEQIPGEEQVQVFSLLESLEQKAAVLSELSGDKVSFLLKELGPQKSAEILSYLSSDDLVDIMEKLEEDLASEILLLLKREEAEEIEELIRYRSDTAGGIMSTDVFSLSEELTVAQAITQIQEAEDMEHPFYVYIVNPLQHLVGVLSLKKLILAKPHCLLKEVMDKDPIRVRLEVDQEEVARIVSRYNYLAIPVVDDANKLMGVITVDDVIDVIQEEAAEDMLLMAGANKQAPTESSLGAGLRKRIPWFLVAWFGGLVVAEIIHVFLKANIPMNVLIGLMPLVLAMGSSVGIQSMTVTVSSLTVERMVFKQLWGVILKEFQLTFLVGLFYGVLLGLFLSFRYDFTSHFAVGMGMGLLSMMMVAAILGSVVPLLFQRVGLDPAIATSPFVAALVSILGIWSYFSLVTWYTPL